MIEEEKQPKEEEYMKIDPATDDAISEIERRIKKIKDTQVTFLNSKETKPIFDAIMSDIQAYCKEIETSIKKHKNDADYFHKKGIDIAFDKRDPFLREAEELRYILNQLELNLNWRNLIFDVILTERKKLYAIISTAREGELKLARLQAEKELVKEKREEKKEDIQRDKESILNTKIEEKMEKIKDNLNKSISSQIEEIRKDISKIREQKPLVKPEIKPSEKPVEREDIMDEFEKSQVKHEVKPDFINKMTGVTDKQKNDFISYMKNIGQITKGEAKLELTKILKMGIIKTDQLIKNMEKVGIIKVDVVGHKQLISLV